VELRSYKYPDGNISDILEANHCVKPEHLGWNSGFEKKIQIRPYSIGKKPNGRKILPWQKMPLERIMLPKQERRQHEE
jgi:hypothetical protein